MEMVQIFSTPAPLGLGFHTDVVFLANSGDPAIPPNMSVWLKSPYMWPNMPLFFETKSRPYNCKPEKGLLITLPVPPLLSLLVTRCICLCTPFPPKPQQ